MPVTANQSRTLRQQVRHPGLCVNVIAGQPVAAGRRLPVMDPSRNEQIAELAEADAATVSAAVRAAAAAFEQGDWPRTPVDTRAHLLREAGIPDGVVNLVNGSGPVTGAALCTHPRVDRISFTGGTETGRQIMSAAGRLAHPGRGKYRGSFH